jgi:hypothetical protein
MGLFGSKKLKVVDPDFGEIESSSVNGARIIWTVSRQFLGFGIEILVQGNKDGIPHIQKQILNNALNNELEIRSECEKALKDQYENAEMEFLSIEEHFELQSISVGENGFEMSFLDKESGNYLFNVQFENNKQVGVSIDS